MEYKKRPTTYNQKPAAVSLRPASRTRPDIKEPNELLPKSQTTQNKAYQILSSGSISRNLGNVKRRLKALVSPAVWQKIQQLSKRQTALLTAGVLVFGLTVPILTVAFQRGLDARTAARYKLLSGSDQLLGAVNKDLAAKITHDESKKTLPIQ